MDKYHYSHFVDENILAQGGWLPNMILPVSSRASTQIQVYLALNPRHFSLQNTTSQMYAQWSIILIKTVSIMPPSFFFFFLKHFCSSHLTAIFILEFYHNFLSILIPVQQQRQRQNQSIKGNKKSGPRWQHRKTLNSPLPQNTPNYTYLQSNYS